MVIKALNVAEKPSVARELANILGGGNAARRHGRSQVLLRATATPRFLVDACLLPLLKGGVVVGVIAVVCGVWWAWGCGFGWGMVVGVVVASLSVSTCSACSV